MPRPSGDAVKLNRPAEKIRIVGPMEVNVWQIN